MSNTSVPQSSPQIPRETILHRTGEILHHRRMHIGANMCSSLLGVLFAAWIIYQFWIADNEPSLVTVLWIVTIYLVVEPITAALTVVRKDRWVSVVFDLLISVALVAEMLIVWYDRIHLGIIGDRATIAGVLFFAMLGSLIGSILIMLIVNTRVLGGTAVPVS
ncbi:MAG TPA: hypothetical protein VMH91_03350 [Candidatus Paceibacterota bacterium]|nr:hypothetical protein [Candidatus Paceibacterota bacterium]